MQQKEYRDRYAELDKKLRIAAKIIRWVTVVTLICLSVIIGFIAWVYQQSN